MIKIWAPEVGLGIFLIFGSAWHRNDRNHCRVANGKVPTAARVPKGKNSGFLVVHKLAGGGGSARGRGTVYRVQNFRRSAGPCTPPPGVMDHSGCVYICEYLPETRTQPFPRWEEGE